MIKLKHLTHKPRGSVIAKIPNNAKTISKEIYIFKRGLKYFKLSKINQLKTFSRIEV